MYPENQEIDVITKTKIFIVFFKICLCVCLLVLGIHVTLWTIDTLNQLINHPDNVQLIQSFLKFQSDKQIINIVVSNDQIMLKDTGVIKWALILILFVILFNVIGRIITGIFSSIVGLLSNLDISRLKTDTRE